MKNIIIALSILASSLFADGNPDKGQTYYFYLFKNELKIDGAEFCALYSQEEWSKLFQNNASHFKKVFSTNQKLEELLGSEKFINEIKPNLEAFTKKYAKDSGYSPTCAQTE